jgi:hypothetical protein
MLLLDAIKKGDTRRRGEVLTLRVGDYYFPLEVVMENIKEGHRKGNGVVQHLGTKTIAKYGLYRGAKLMEIDQEELSRLSGEYVLTISQAKVIYRGIISSHAYAKLLPELGTRFTVEQLRNWISKQII